MTRAVWKHMSTAKMRPRIAATASTTWEEMLRLSGGSSTFLSLFRSLGKASSTRSASGSTRGGLGVVVGGGVVGLLGVVTLGDAWVSSVVCPDLNNS